MHHFFVQKENITGTEILIDDSRDFNHAVRVLRLQEGEKILVSDPEGKDYLCTVDRVLQEAENNGTSALRVLIEAEPEQNHELPAKVILFQCMPKSDKMELIIQKAVELGVSEIVPVASKNCVLKLDEKKADSKIRRWQAIAESAAKQSKRSIVPAVREPISFREAVEACEGCDLGLIPYEEEKGLTGTCEAIVNFLPGRSIGVIIGPEGGFDPLEAAMAKRHGILPVSLGRRILRAETAAIAILSLIMIRLEIAAGMELETEE